MAATLIPNEAKRLRASREYHVLTLPEQAYDDIVCLAAVICGTSIALISLVNTGSSGVQGEGQLRDDADSEGCFFLRPCPSRPEELFIVTDTHRDNRFSDNGLVWSRPHIRFYAGTPLVTLDRQVLGTLCVIDGVPRTHTSPPSQ